MKLFTFETADIVHVVDPGLLGGLPRVNLECVAYLQEIRRKPSEQPTPCGFLHIGVDGMNLTVARQPLRESNRQCWSEISSWPYWQESDQLIVLRDPRSTFS